MVVLAGRVVEAEVDEVCGDDAGDVAVTEVVDAESGAGTVEEVEDIVCDPRVVPEFEDSEDFRRKYPDEVIEAREVFVETGRQLIEDGAEIFSQGFYRVEEILEGLFGVFEFLDVGDKAVGFDGVTKTLRGEVVPSFDGLFLREVIVSVVDLDGVEITGIVLEPVLFG